MLITQQLLSGLMLGGVYVMVAVAFTLTIGMLNFLNFTIPPIFMIAGMVGWGLTYYGLPFGLSDGGIHWAAALAVGLAAAREALAAAGLWVAGRVLPDRENGHSACRLP